MKHDPHQMMCNWSRWAHSGDDVQHLEAKISSLWRFWLPSKHRDDGWGDPAAPEAMPDPIDTQAAEECDKALKRIAVQHYNILLRAYYRQQKVNSLDLDAALRALGDVLNNKMLDMKSRLWDFSSTARSP